MKTNKRILSWTAACYVAVAATAQTVNVSPIPQRIVWGDKAFDQPKSIVIKGAEDADADAVALLREHFTEAGKGVKVIIGERGDKAVKAYDKQIPDKVEGYYINIGKKQVVIAGADEAGTYYGVQTFLQMVSQPEVMTAEVKDWPDVLERGVVEGFYGNPWSHKDRLRQFDFYGRNKMNVYIYGPKDDPYHRNQWREAYPADEAQRISELAKAAAQNKVDFVWAMHPGGDIQWNEADLKSSIQKLEWMYGLGVRAFAIFFDDIFGAEQSKGTKQAEYMNYLNREFVQKHPDVAPLILCPTQYNKSWSGGSYLSDLGTTMDKEIRIMWTGATVVDMINQTDMDWINAQIQRNAYIWLNYPVNDFCIDHMLMGPTYGNDLNIAHQLSGFVSNPMEYAEASKVSLYSIADYTWNMDAYSSVASWERALAELMPEHVDAFRLFCQHNIDLGPTGHGLRRKDESKIFKQAAEAFTAAMADGYDAAAVEAMTKEFTAMVTAADELLSSTEEPEMIAEITPWVEVMKIIGQRGQLVMQLHTLLNKGDEKAFIAAYEQLAQLEQAQKAILSRNFEGSIKKPNPTVANEVVVPFIKASTKNLIREYKSKHTYRKEVFPADLIEEGRYYIKVNGRWLTDVNANPDRTGDYPVLQAEEDVINPQRQEWNIAIDPTTERYKITNAQDGRYINEHGNFWRDKSLNPYDPAWHSVTIYRMNGKYAIRTAGNAGGRMWTADEERIYQAPEQNVRNDHFIFEIIPVGGETPAHPTIESGEAYYIMDGEGRCLTNMNVGGQGGTPEFAARREGDKAQLWVLTIVEETGRYNLKSAADDRYVNEICNFGTNQYNPLWNTYVLTEQNGKFAIRNAGNGGSQFWIVNGKQPGTANIPTAEAYQWTITK
ncbi:MAG: beta-N-acetylglucosaminidase domain-containing protein [Bacteroidaceae bacterium]|nr:beta-N-acetylglucosaminidase domain-containing protein [Bacteroidaceae bacterium]